jgi:hypothetical protein
VITKDDLTKDDKNVGFDEERSGMWHGRETMGGSAVPDKMRSRGGEGAIVATAWLSDCRSAVAVN